MSIGRFFAMVGALVWHPAAAKYLVLKRSPDKDFASGAWECITGRVDQGESFSWMTAEQAGTLLPEGHWLGKAIQRAEEIRARTPAALMTYFRTHGFEL